MAVVPTGVPGAPMEVGGRKASQDPYGTALLLDSPFWGLGTPCDTPDEKLRESVGPPTPPIFEKTLLDGDHFLAAWRC